MIWEGKNRCTRRKLVPVSLWPSQIVHELIWLSSCQRWEAIDRPDAWNRLGRLKKICGITFLFHASGFPKEHCFSKVARFVLLSWYDSYVGGDEYGAMVQWHWQGKTEWWLKLTPSIVKDLSLYCAINTPFRECKRPVHFPRLLMLWPDIS